MTTPITFTLDLEDHRQHRQSPARHGDNTRRLLDWLEQRAIRGTVFVVGEVAEDDPMLVRDIAARGHEVAFHSFSHRPLTVEQPVRFRQDAVRGRALLEDLAGHRVRGYRAPSFSLTPATRWAIGILAESGFVYSSSVLPGRHPLYGYPGLPGVPFHWPEGLLELPVPLAACGPWRLPYLGGIYLRYLPFRMIRWLHERAVAPNCGWTYCHPYDFDPDEPFTAIKDAPLWVSALLWFNRGATHEKLDAVLALGHAPSFAERIARGEFTATPTLAAADLG